MRKCQAVPGMDDIFPGEVEKWQWVEERLRTFFEARTYREIRTPVVEFKELFSRGIGDTTDVVHKEMYVFEDRGGRQLALRPEMTASVARAVLEKGLLKTHRSLRLYYLGPMFRAERPQAGRRRQFHQAGIELIKEEGPESDFEAVYLLYEALRYTGVQCIQMKLNDLSRIQHDSRVKEKLVEYFQRYEGTLCKDCKWRLERNVLRIFDCKSERCQEVIDNVPWQEWAPLPEAFHEVVRQLEQKGVPLEVQRRLVRGLDYYTGFVFEVVAPELGAQDALAGGGRYDKLYEALGGSPTPSIGFSIGLERLIRVLENTSPSPPWTEDLKRTVYLACLEESESFKERMRDLALRLREQRFRIDMDLHETSLSRHLKRAQKAGIRYVAIFGEEEWRRSVFLLKDLEQKWQREIPWTEAVSDLRKILEGARQ